jgi:S-adenosylmethionine:tRNA ribosyltransferase-isomerase
MLTSDFDYQLPQELIAQEPAIPRDSCRLLVLHRKDGTLEHKHFTTIIDYLNPGDLLVANNTRVMPARLLGSKADTGGAVELLLLRQADIPAEALTSAPANHDQAGALVCAPAKTAPQETDLWEALVKPGKRLKPGARVVFAPAGDNAQQILEATVVDWLPHTGRGARLVSLQALDGSTVDDALHRVGTVPLPPYITHYHGDRELYQTVFAQHEHSAAAPTAGLHFTPELLCRIRDKGVGFATVELEVGLDTFRTVDEPHIEDHVIHTERYHVAPAVAQAVAHTRANGGRVIAVGTTSVRSLESAWDAQKRGLAVREAATTSLYITPGYRFNVVDALITNFHVPRSTLMMLVSAFATHGQVLRAYNEAIGERYRFLSFGDAMFID